MAQKIQKTFSIEHVVKGYQKVLGLAKELNKKGASNEDTIKKLQAEYNAAKLNPNVSLETLEIYEENLKKAFKEINKQAIENTRGIGSASKKLAKQVADELEKVDKALDSIDKKETKLDKKFQVKEDGSFGASRSGDLYKTQVAPALDKKMAKDTFVNPFTGKTLTDTANYVKKIEELDEILEGQTEKDKKIAAGIKKKISEGKKYSELNQKELAYLAKVKKQNKEIVISEEEIFSQLKTTNKLKKEEQKILKKAYDQEKKQIDIEKEKYKNRRIALKESEADYQKRVKQQKNLSEADKKANEDLASISSEATKGTAELTREQKARRKAEREATKTTKQNTQATKNQSTTLGKAAKQVFNYGLAFTALRRIYTETLSTIRDLDSALTEMAIVTSMSREESWELVGTMQDLARETGFTTTEIAKLSTVYFRQGRTLREVIELTRVAAQAARVAGISAGQSADFLTSAVNAFRLSADEALAVSDRFAALAASSASSYEELATGLSKFAAQANVAGIGIDFAMGMLAKGVETTREAPETIGTAIKSVTARMRELSDLGKTFEDGMDINRVETALRQVGVALRDESGQFRNLEEVLTDVGMKFSSLNKNQQASVAVALAGIRQQSRLISIMNDFERTQELVDISTQSSGATMAQHTEFMKGMEAAVTELRTSYQQFITTITESDLIIGIIRGLAKTIEIVSNALEGMGASGRNSMIAIGLLAAGLKSYSVIQSIANSQTTIGIALQKLLGISANKTTASILGFNFAAEAMQIKTAFLSNGLKAAIKATIKFGASLMATPIGWIAAGLATVAAGFLLYKKGADDAKKGTDSFASNFYDAINSFGELFKGLFDTVKNLIRVFTNVIGIILRLGSRSRFVTNVITKLKIALNALEVVINGTAWIFQWFGNQLEIAADKLQKVKEKIDEFIKNSKIVGFFATLFGVDNSQGLFEAIDNGLNAVENRISNIADETERALERLKSYTELSDDLKELRKETEAENFQLTKKNRTIRDLLDEYEELQRLREQGVFGEDELQRQDDLIAELENFESQEGFEPGELFRFDADGRVISNGIEYLQNQILENEDVISRNLSELAKRSLVLAEKEFNTFLKNRDGAFTDLQNYFINQMDLDPSQGDIDKQREALRNYISAVVTGIGQDEISNYSIEQLGEVINRELEDGESVTQNLINQINEFDDFLLNFDPETKGFVDIKNAYEDLKESFKDEDAKKAFEEVNKDLEVVIDSLENFSDTEFEEISNVLDFIGFKPQDLNNLIEVLDGSRFSIESFLKEVDTLAASLENQGVDSANAVSRAISQIASTMEDAETAAQLYGIAIKNTMLEASQAADLLASRLENLTSKQESFISGELSSEDLFNLVENYSTLFADADFVNAFRSGGDLSRFLTEEIMDQYQVFEDALFQVEAQLNSYKNGVIELTEAELEGLLAQRNRLLLLMDYRGELSNLTTAQYAANKALESYTRLEKLGLATSESRLNLIKTLRDNIGPAMFESTERINDLNTQIADLVGVSADASLDHIYKIVDGVLVVQSGFNELTGVVQNQVSSVLGLVDNELETILGNFEQYMNQVVAHEEQLAKEKIKVYEDYFDKLDKLEAQREIQTDRASLVEQIARLQGATDEASRKRALDLRKELNKLDEKSEDQIVKDARDSLINSVNESVAAVKKEFENVITSWINSGTLTAESLYQGLVSSGLADSNGWAAARLVVDPSEIPGFDDTSTVTDGNAEPEPSSTPEIPEDPIKDLGTATNNLTTATEDLYKAIAAYYGDSGAQVDLDNGSIGAGIGHFGGIGDTVNPESINPTPPSQGGGGGGGGSSEGFRFERDGMNGAIGFSKGGLVDYTGMAMLHGSKTDPEAVLNPDQTKIFKKIPEMLASLSKNNNPISIENISISTESLNTNQDFANAGETLAKAFSKAIQRKGVTVNTKR